MSSPELIPVSINRSRKGKIFRIKGIGTTSDENESIYNWFSLAIQHRVIYPIRTFLLLENPSILNPDEGGSLLDR